MKNVLIAMIFVLLLGMTGCSDSMPECDDSEVKDLLNQIMHDTLKDYFDVPQSELDKMEITYDKFLLQSIDKDTKKIVCKAEASTRYDGEHTETEWIEYSVQYTQDGSHVYVEIIP